MDLKQESQKTEQKQLPNICWNAYEFQYRKKSKDRPIIVMIVSITIAVVAFIYDNILFAIIAILGGIFIKVLSSRKPDFCEFRLNEKGAIARDTVYKIETINGYNIVKRSEAETQLVFTTTETIGGTAHFPIRKRDVEAIEEYFSYYDIPKIKDLDITVSELISQHI
ncbi:MAG: hypothetical protein OXU73_00785 [Candidatus Campbellbacteria bacterium]|nr:hypothetical protein [Candidatus Campbellbacteria bacterium]